MRETGRVAWLEPARGFALFGHCFRDSMRQTGADRASLNDFVCAFRVPALFFIYGMRWSVKRFSSGSRSFWRARRLCASCARCTFVVCAGRSACPAEEAP